MGYLKFTVSEECIACRACVEVAEENYDINDNNKAYLYKQPENEEEEANCKEAMEVCPVDAISIVEIEASPVLSRSNIKETLDKYPQLKPVLLKLSPKFRRLQTPAMYNTLARFATFQDASKLTGVSICEILRALNEHLGVKDKLLESMPDCITSAKEEEITGEDIAWQESGERYIYNEDSLFELTDKISKLKPQENIVIISVEKPDTLLKTADGLGYKINIEKTKEYRISIFNPQEVQNKVNWLDRKDDFEILDVRTLTTDPFDIIIKRSYDIEEDSGFILIQRFEPTPIINMLSEMGFESVTETKGAEEIWVYLHKKVSDKTKDKSADDEKPNVVIQSATPVAYPVIMRLLQSKVIRKSVNIKELKVWEETEKHLGWIVNGKADISFSALVTTSKLGDADVKIPALFVWDNFCILTRGYKAEGFEDIKGKDIYTPLFGEAPPAKITKYLIKASGLNPEEFNFVFGKPFGRPEIIFKDFLSGKVDTVILREPEASYAIKMMQNRGEEISIISYNKLWNDINEGFGSFPNAGVVLKGEFVRKYPELTKVFLEELKKAIDWVNKNRSKSAKLSYDMMRQPVESVELFLERVNFEYVEGDRLVNKVSQFFNVLTEQGIIDAKIDDKFLGMFKLN